MRPRFIGKVLRGGRSRGPAQRIAREVKTERVVQVFEAIFAEVRNDRRATVR
jgi:hypothetical protein